MRVLHDIRLSIRVVLQQVLSQEDLVDYSDEEAACSMPVYGSR